MARLQIGDVVDIKTNKGLAYAQYTHKDKKWGYFIRVFPSLFDQLPPDLSNAIQGKPIVSTFVPLQAIVNKGIFTVSGNLPIPEEYRPFPTLKDSVTFGDRDDWWLYDGKRKWFKGKLNKKELEYPDLEVCKDLYLVESIEIAHQ